MSYINRNRARQTGTNRTTQAEISNLARHSFPGRRLTNLQPTPQSLRILPGKPLVLDQNGFMIHCSIKSGTCITVYPAKSTRQMFVWKDGTIDGTGAGTTGVVIQNGVDVHVGPIHIKNSAQTRLVWASPKQHRGQRCQCDKRAELQRCGAGEQHKQQRFAPANQ